MKLIEVFKDALPVIRSASPFLAGMLGGAPGMVLGNIVPLLATAFESHPHNLADLVKNIVSDPHAEAKIQSVEAMHGDWLRTLTDNLSTLSEAEINVKLKWQMENDTAKE